VYPILIIEVLSKSTEAFDQGEKFTDYQTCPTLQEYVLINQSQRKIECYRRELSGFWSEQCYKAGKNSGNGVDRNGKKCKLIK
jgi:Uma2 family endonuclease